METIEKTPSHKEKLAPLAKREWRNKDESAGGEHELYLPVRRIETTGVKKCRFFLALESLAVKAAWRCCDL